MKLFLAFLLVLCASNLAPAQAPEQPSDTTETSGTLIPIPILFYSPETRLAGGISAIYYFRTGARTREMYPSLVAPTLIYTLRRQIIADLYGDIYLSRNNYRVDGSLSFVRFPNIFYGIGPDTDEAWAEDYTPQRFGLDLAVQRSLAAGLRAGPHVMFNYHRLTATEDGGMLHEGDIPGAAGGRTMGLGIRSTYDTRDNSMSAYSGQYHQLSALFFPEMIGGEYQHTRFMIDMRAYFQMAPRHILAVQGYGRLSTGNVPFYQMATLGGTMIMRGYLDGRYRDRNLLFAQLEYRMPVWWRLGAAAFVGMGDVSHTISDFNMVQFKYSYGVGLRFLLDDYERMNVRLDFGFGENSSGIYVTVSEAF